MPSLTPQHDDELGGPISVVVAQKCVHVRFDEHLERPAEGAR